MGVSHRDGEIGLEGDKLETWSPELGEALSSVHWAEVTTWKGVEHGGSVSALPHDALPGGVPSSTSPGCASLGTSPHLSMLHFPHMLDKDDDCTHRMGLK